MVTAARQGALSLTTIDHEHVDDNVQHLDSSTGSFRDDFEQRAKPFADAARKAQSKSVGTVTAAGIESDGGEQGRGPVGDDGDDIERRCARTPTEGVADSGHGVADRRWFQGLPGGVRPMRLREVGLSRERLREYALPGVALLLVIAGIWLSWDTSSRRDARRRSGCDAGRR